MSTTDTTTIELLIQTWRRVLRLPAVGLEDNFFDLRGSYSQAVQLFQILSEARGLQLPPVLIYYAPTVAAQASLLKNPTSYEPSPVVPLRLGRSDLMVFIAPGLGGLPADFFPLAKLMPEPYSVYGLQPKGIDGLEQPSEQIEDMAVFCKKGIVNLQPRGPYILVGYSLGGLVFLEVARQLASKGEKIALLAMLDSYPHVNFLKLLSTGQRWRSALRRAKAHAMKLVRRDRTHVLSDPVVGANNVSTFTSTFENVRDAGYVALRRYKPTFYQGPIKFIRAAEVSNFPENPKTVWSHLVENLEIETVPGDHVGMVTTHRRALATVLNRYLQDVAVFSSRIRDAG